MAIEQLFKVKIAFSSSHLVDVKKQLVSTKKLQGVFNWKIVTKEFLKKSQIESYFVKKLDALRFEKEIKQILKKHKVVIFFGF
jgi:hypothetical protein